MRALDQIADMQKPRVHRCNLCDPRDSPGHADTCSHPVLTSFASVEVQSLRLKRERTTCAMEVDRMATGAVLD